MSERYHEYYREQCALFHELHHSGFVLPNAWCPMSALAFEHAGYKAVGTTSKGVANWLGFNDGEVITFKQLLAQVDAMLNVISIPLSVDIEKGYANDAEAIANNVLALAERGVVGINLEDSTADFSALTTIDRMCHIIDTIQSACRQQGYDKFFINLRCDSFLLPQSATYAENDSSLAHFLEAVIARITAYIGAGADGVFLPGLTQPADIQQITQHVDVPINVMTLPNFTDTKSILSSGIRRVSIGNGLSDQVVRYVTQQIQTFKHTKDAATFVFDEPLTMAFRA